MNERLQALKQRAEASSKSTQATLQRTAPKTSLLDIKQAAEKRFGQRKSKKQKPVQQKPKQVQPKKQPKKPKAVRSDALEQWKMAMEKANIAKHKWRKLEDKISRLSGPERIKIEKELFDHEMFKDVYSVGEDDPSIVDDYLSDLEEKLDELKNDNIDVLNMVENVNKFLQENPTLGVVAVKYVVGGNNMEFKVHEVDNGVVFEDETGRLLAGFNSAELDTVEKKLLEDVYNIVNNGDDNNWTTFEPLSPEEFAKLLKQTQNNRLD